MKNKCRKCLASFQGVNRPEIC